MAGQIPEPRSTSGHVYDDRRSALNALVVAVLLDATIIGVFLVITWVTYATK